MKGDFNVRDEKRQKELQFGVYRCCRRFARRPDPAKHGKSEHVSVKKQVCQIEVYADTLQDTERRDLKGSSLKGRKNKQGGSIPPHILEQAILLRREVLEECITDYSDP